MAIEASGLNKTYPPTIWKKWFTCGKRKVVVAVQDLSFIALKGQILVLLGVNGSGKTTTLDLVGGLQKVTSGSIYINTAESYIGKQNQFRPSPS